MSSASHQSGAHHNNTSFKDPFWHTLNTQLCLPCGYGQCMMMSN